MIKNVCDKCEGRGKLRHNTTINGKYTLGFIECDACSGLGEITIEDTQFVKDAKDKIIERLVEEVAFWMNQFNNNCKENEFKVSIDKEKILLDAWSRENESEEEEEEDMDEHKCINCGQWMNDYPHKCKETESFEAKLRMNGSVVCSCGGNVISNTGKIMYNHKENKVYCWLCNKEYDCDYAYSMRKENETVQLD